MKNQDKIEQIKALIKDYPTLKEIEKILREEKEYRTNGNYWEDKLPQEIYDNLSLEYLDLAKGLKINVNLMVNLNYKYVCFSDLMGEFTEEYPKIKFTHNLYPNEVVGELKEIIDKQEEKFFNFSVNLNKVSKKYDVEAKLLFTKIQSNIDKILEKNWNKQFTYSIEKIIE